MRTELRWPGSIAEQAMLVLVIGKFLRRRREGWQQLTNFLLSIPEDRTDAEYQLELEQSQAEREAFRAQGIADYNERRASRGLPQVKLNERGAVIRLRNRAQEESSQSLQRAVASVQRSSSRRLTAKEVLRILDLPDSRRRAVSRCITELSGGKVAKRRAK